MSATVWTAVAAFSIFAQAAPASPPGQPSSVYEAITGEIDQCVGKVAGEFASRPFDQILDQAVLRCGGLIPFPVPPVERRAAMTEQQVQDRKERQDRTTRNVIGRELRVVIELNSQPGRAPQ